MITFAHSKYVVAFNIPNSFIHAKLSQFKIGLRLYPFVFCSNGNEEI